ncbi:MAG: hypothetical protein ABR566_00730, partial [Pyrinomonadaceae bacterium]
MFLRRSDTKKKQNNLPQLNSIPAPMVSEVQIDDETRPLPVIQIPVPAPQIPAPVLNAQTSQMGQSEIARMYPAPQIPNDALLQTAGDMNLRQSAPLPPAPQIRNQNPLTPDTTTPADVPFHQRTGEMLPPAPVIRNTAQIVQPVGDSFNYPAPPIFDTSTRPRVVSDTAR